MRVFKLEEMVKGWFVGNFAPTVLRTSAVEVAIKEYAQGSFETMHYHKIATEITAIINGRAKLNGLELNPGDIVVLEPGEPAAFEHFGNCFDDSPEFTVRQA